MRSLNQFVFESSNAVQEVFNKAKDIITTAIHSRSDLEPEHSDDVEELAKLCSKLNKTNESKETSYICVVNYYSRGGSKLNKLKVIFIDKDADFGRAGSSPIAVAWKGLLFGTDTVIMKADADFVKRKQSNEEFTFYKIDSKIVKDLWDLYNSELNNKK